MPPGHRRPDRPPAPSRPPDPRRDGERADARSGDLSAGTAPGGAWTPRRISAPASAGACRPTVKMVTRVKARDRRCRFPGCTIAAVFCDMDHVRPWPTGPTADTNLICLRGRHHRVKQRPGWSITLAPDATVTVTVTWTEPHRPGPHHHTRRRADLHRPDQRRDTPTRCGATTSRREHHGRTHRTELQPTGTGTGTGTGTEHWHHHPRRPRRRTSPTPTTPRSDGLVLRHSRGPQI